MQVQSPEAPGSNRIYASIIAICERKTERYESVFHRYQTRTDPLRQRSILHVGRHANINEESVLRVMSALNDAPTGQYRRETNPDGDIGARGVGKEVQSW